MKTLNSNLWNKKAEEYRSDSFSSYNASIYHEALELASRMIDKGYILNSLTLQFFHAVMDKVDNGSYTEVVTLDDAIDMV